MRTFTARRNEDMGSVVINICYPNGQSTPLTHRVQHSPTGMEWGYNGSGPADLARSILWELIGEEPETALYQKFKYNFIATAPYVGFVLQEDEIEMWIENEIKDWLDGFEQFKNRGGLYLENKN